MLHDVTYLVLGNKRRRMLIHINLSDRGYEEFNASNRLYPFPTPVNVNSCCCYFTVIYLTWSKACVVKSLVVNLRV